MSENINESYFRKLIKGDIPLTTSFWGWFVFIFFIMNIFIDLSFENVDLFRSKAQQTIDMLLYFLTIIYAVLIFITVYRSALKHKGSKLFALFTKIVVTIHLLFALTTAVDVIRVYFFEDYAIQSEINSFKESLPMKVDSYTNLTDINKEKKDILYTYQFLKIDLQSTPEHDYRRFKKRVQESICDNESNLSLLKKDYIMKYKYLDKNGSEILNITTKKETCGKGIYDSEILKEILRLEARF